MHRVLYKCPHCNKKPNVANNPTQHAWRVFCCSLIVQYRTENEARCNWNDYVKALFDANVIALRRAVFDGG